ncbi:MAG TPA: TolC family protein [Kiritimatiellia bacterium]|nr:TolC family protein [Kiritimatiellia bacterium]HRZ11759.1 TolC family protein [Kiritimatiellia bacterium]HSA17434.1 TolC family protein [Kiritimatiellia bacterium]
MKYRLVMIGVLLAGGAVARAGEPPLTFRDGVARALEHSPYLAVGELDVAVQRLGEADARSDFIPQFSLRTRYYLDPPAGSDERFQLSFTVDPYNPVEAKLSVEARELLTDLAVLSHLQAVAECLHRVGQGWLELEALSELEAVERAGLELAEAAAAASSDRAARGVGTEPDAQAAGRELEIRRLRLDHLKRTRADVLEGLGALIGASPAEPLNVDAKDAGAEVLGDPPGAETAWEAVRDRSIEAQARELRRKLQEIRILAARAAYIPDLWLGVSTPDPLSGFNDGDFYFSVGVDIPIWDGWKRARDIARQKQELRRQDQSGLLDILDFRARWRAAESACRAAEIEWRAAQAAEERTALRRRQAGEGEAERAARADWLEARRRAIQSGWAWRKACLDRDALSGALIDRLCKTETEQP